MQSKQVFNVEVNRMLEIHQKLKLIGFAIGIFVCYTLFGIIQEKIFRGHYEDGNVVERFSFPITFTAVQCIFNAIIARVIIMTHNHPKNETHQAYYGCIAIFYCLAMVTSNFALKWIPYTTQVIFKSTKPIPVMLFSVLVARKTYAMQKYFFILMIVIGVAMFSFKNVHDKSDGENPQLGNILLIISLLMDGFMAGAQDRMRIVSRPTPLNFMTYVNGWSSIVAVAGVFAFREAFEFIAFSKRHPEMLIYLSSAIIVGALGQLFISSMISNFGSLPLAVVTTIRKFFTVLLSVLIFRNDLSLRQWSATGIIFSALLLDSIFNKKPPLEDEKNLAIDIEAPTVTTKV